MESLLGFLQDNGKVFLTVAVVLGSAWFLYKKKTRTSYKPRVCGVDYPRDVVMFHALRRDRLAPNLGHFCIKLETYLRINKIPYQFDGTSMPRPKEKVPWIEYNGVTMGDSQLIIQYLEEEFKVNLNAHLASKERAIAWAVQKWIEEFTYWLNVYTRWVIFNDDMFKIQSTCPKYMKIPLRRKVESMLHAVGVGRHSKEEVHAMMVNDLKQFSGILGGWKYIMGDRICDVDCAAFGILSQIRWCTPSACPGNALLQGDELRNVTDYMDRIRNEFWPDWGDIISKAT
ncbi:failed axon connections homolog [Mya arenaria]|uniref:failed axon connections homolog n=1 Tax=Mya arenaria TaxID=6604 RepID=UPI0022E6DE28|nr:failed axon connections homolog [Mya arenaria]XP_052763874.1 failed axon connections homolog [Mya arenaria]XP_052763875.1 failed axon connections homolog [Mya arenaria]XP_052763876.1 failed axon connections homolog [Mya arenaria]